VVRADLGVSEFGLDGSFMRDANLVPTEAMFLKELMRIVEFKGVYEPGALAEHIARRICG